MKYLAGLFVLLAMSVGGSSSQSRRMPQITEKQIIVEQGTQRVILTWENPVICGKDPCGIVRNKVYKVEGPCPSSVSQFKLIYSSDAPVTEYTDTNLFVGNNCYYVEALDSSGNTVERPRKFRVTFK